MPSSNGFQVAHMALGKEDIQRGAVGKQDSLWAHVGKVQLTQDERQREGKESLLGSKEKKTAKSV